MSLTKKIFIVSSILLVVLLFFGGIYFFAFRKTPATTKTNISLTKTDPETIKKPSDSAIIAVSDEPVLAPVLVNNDSAIRYYTKNDGRVYEIDLDGSKKKTISDKILNGLADIYWSPDRTKVIAKFRAPGDRFQFNFFDYGTSTGSSLSSNIDTIAWQNNSKIVYKYFDPKVREGSLNISDPNGKNWTKLSPLNTKYISLAPIPKSGLISAWKAPDASTETFLGSIAVLGGETQMIHGGTFGTDYLWSNDGNYLLASSSDKQNGSKMNLFLMNNRGEDLKPLGIPTFVSKCIWSKNNKTLFYALPSSVPDNAVMPNDYLNGKINTTDTFWKVDVTSGEKTRLVDLDKIKDQFDATNLFLNANESLLFFVSRVDGKLYKITL